MSIKKLYTTEQMIYQIISIKIIIGLIKIKNRISQINFISYLPF